MLYVMAVIRPQSEHIATVGNALTALALGSRVERGCSHYDVFRRAGEAVFLTHETWVDEAALQAHMAGPNVAATFASVGHLLAAPPEIHHYTQVV